MRFLQHKIDHKIAQNLKIRQIFIVLLKIQHFWVGRLHLLGQYMLYKIQRILNTRIIDFCADVWYIENVPEQK